MPQKKKKRVISMSNKETVADIYPAELKADHKFNFAEQTPPYLSVCLGLFAATLTLYLQDVIFICETVGHLLVKEMDLNR